MSDGNICKQVAEDGKQNKFGVEKCSICDKKITNELEETFIKIVMAIKMIRGNVSKLDSETALDVIGEDWKSKVYEAHGDMMKDKYSIQRIRTTQVPMMESVAKYMKAFIKAWLHTYDENSKEKGHYKDMEVISEDTLPDDVREKFGKLPPPDTDR